MPLSLGYLFATEQHTHREYETSNQYNLSDLIINSQTPYYGDYTGSTNNNALYQYRLNPTQGYRELQLETPNYVSVTENQSSLPVYQRVTHDKTADHQAGTETYNGNNNGQSFGPAISGYDTPTFSIPSYAYGVYTLHISSYIVFEGILHFQLNDNDGYGWYTYIPTSQFTDGDIIKIYRIGQNEEGGWTYRLESSKLIGGYVETSNFRFIFPQAYSALGFGITYSWYNEYFNLNDLGIMSIFNIGPAFVLSNRGYQYTVLYSNVSYYSQNTNNMIINGVEYNKNEYRVILTSSYSPIQYYTSEIVSNQYGDPAEGWAMPREDGVTVPTGRAYWFNEQTNKSVDLYISFTSSDRINLMPTNTITDDSNFDLSISYSNGKIYLNTGSIQDENSTLLGYYSFIVVSINPDNYTISGLKSWPSMYQPAEKYNTITLDRSAIKNQDYHYIKLDASVYPHFRVDSTNVLAGTFPSTKNYTFNISEKFPDVGFQITFNSIAYYGEALTVYDGEGNPTNIDLVNGRISLQGQTFPLRGSTWIWEPQEDNTFILKINNYLVFDEGITQLPQIYFGGEWSIILTGYSLKPITVTTNDFAVGQFQFGPEGFAAAGVVTSSQGFCVLGLTGKMSISKVAILALVFGGAVAVYLMEI